MILTDRQKKVFKHHMEEEEKLADFVIKNFEEDFKDSEPFIKAEKFSESEKEEFAISMLAAYAGGIMAALSNEKELDKIFEIQRT